MNGLTSLANPIEHTFIRATPAFVQGVTSASGGK